MIVDYTDDGRPVYSGDPHAVAVSREPRGYLPERSAAGNELVASPDGTVGPRAEMLAPTPLRRLEDFDFSGLAPEAPAPVQRKGKGRRGRSQAAGDGSLIPAAVVDRRLGGDPIYSSDPAAPSMVGVPLDDAERHELRRMLKEMEHPSSRPIPSTRFQSVAAARSRSLGVAAVLHRINLHFHDLRREAGWRWLDSGAPRLAARAVGASLRLSAALRGHLQPKAVPPKRFARRRTAARLSGSVPLALRRSLHSTAFGGLA